MRYSRLLPTAIETSRVCYFTFYTCVKLFYPRQIAKLLSVVLVPTHDLDSAVVQHPYRTKNCGGQTQTPLSMWCLRACDHTERISVKTARSQLPTIAAKRCRGLSVSGLLNFQVICFNSPTCLSMLATTIGHPDAAWMAYGILAAPFSDMLICAPSFGEC